MLEGDAEQRFVADGEVVAVDSQRWMLYLPAPVEPTMDRRAERFALDSVTLAFAVSRDEETVELTLRGARKDVKLESRTGWYLLLVLARLRAKEEAAGRSVA